MNEENKKMLGIKMGKEKGRERRGSTENIKEL